jgi:hypothetical protein
MHRNHHWIVAAAFTVMPQWSWAADESWNACAMMPQASVEAAFGGRKFDAGTLAKSVVKSTPSMAAMSQCTYTSAGATPQDRITVGLLARRAPSDTTGVTPEAAKAGAVQLKSTPVDVPGLGPGAYSVDMGSKALPSIKLNVFRGKRDWLIFGCTGKSVDSDTALANLATLARAQLQR